MYQPAATVAPTSMEPTGATSCAQLEVATPCRRHVAVDATPRVVDAPVETDTPSAVTTAVAVVAAAAEASVARAPADLSRDVPMMPHVSDSDTGGVTPVRDAPGLPHDDSDVVMSFASHDGVATVATPSLAADADTDTRDATALYAGPTVMPPPPPTPPHPDGPESEPSAPAEPDRDGTVQCGACQTWVQDLPDQPLCPWCLNRIDPPGDDTSDATVPEGASPAFAPHVPSPRGDRLLEVAALHPAFVELFSPVSTAAQAHNPCPDVTPDAKFELPRSGFARPLSPEPPVPQPSAQPQVRNLSDAMTWPRYFLKVVESLFRAGVLLDFEHKHANSDRSSTDSGIDAMGWQT
mmetsp:Transcript_141292/g.451578  ORF Transcript_141292/g.451578 Transcript_141292/m.451578 type:complete len:351 (-) Transcript_141292:1321-2373(-)